MGTALVLALLVVALGVVIGVTIVVACRALQHPPVSQGASFDPAWEIDRRLREGLSEMLRVVREERR